jgi:hypothetical protein
MNVQAKPLSEITHQAIGLLFKEMGGYQHRTFSESVHHGI